MKHTRNTTQEENSSTGNKWGGLLKSQTLTKLEKEFNLTTEEIAYHIGIRDLTTCEEQKEIEQSIIDKRVKHLAELEEKMKQ